MKYYDDNAEQYYKNTINADPHELCLMFTDGARRFLNKDIHNISVLDLGCGSARDSIYLSGEGFNVTGIDLSFKLLGHAVSSAINSDNGGAAESLTQTKRLTSLSDETDTANATDGDSALRTLRPPCRAVDSLPSMASSTLRPPCRAVDSLPSMASSTLRPPCRAAFLCADFTKLPFKDVSFDAVFAQASLLHVPKAKLAAVLNEVNRVMRPGGLIYLSLKEGAGESLDEKGRFFAYYDSEELETEISNNGFKTVDFKRKASRDGLNNVAIWLMYLALKV
ncbi:MAG TPA: methyltransferase domain-containing protein [Candidatus Wallbacteria bacterium]|nr:methyltransferase domain-containing protein [Candidatus Wallbacteria bacterium]